MSDPLIVDNPTFNIEVIRPGYLVILKDYNQQLIATGYVVEASEMELKLNVFRQEDDFRFEVTGAVNYRLPLSDVLSQTIRLTIINPDTH